jgi:hypothetical protein
MANSILTPTAVTRKALSILHQKLNFIGKIDRQHDSSFAVEGAKIGDSLKIRLPNQYTVTEGAALSVQDTSETSTTLQITEQDHVDTTFSSQELTLDLDDFAERILDPAMSVLAAKVESKALQAMYKDVYNQANNVGSSATMAKVLEARKKLVDNLAPPMYVANMDTQMNVDLVDAFKTFNQDAPSLAKQYKEGLIARTASFEFFENTMMPIHTSGSDDGTGDYLTNSATAQTGSTLTIDTGTGTLLAGDVFTIAGVNRVHPETKLDTGQLQQFVVTADTGASATSVSISPAIVASGARQNVTNGAANNQALTKVGGASATYNVGLGYSKQAFTFATADLVMPQGVDFAAREVMDNLSMRIVRSYDINSDKFPVRIDLLYGYKAQRPELAVRMANN